MDHQPVGTGVEVPGGACERVVEPAVGDQALDPSHDHELVAQARGAPACELGAEDRRVLELWRDPGPEAVALRRPLVLDDDGGRAHRLEPAAQVLEVDGVSAGVAVDDQRLVGDVEDLLDRREAARHPDDLGVGQSLGGGAGQARRPEPVEGERVAARALDPRRVGDDRREAVVGLEEAETGADGERALQRAAAAVGEGAMPE